MSLKWKIILQLQYICPDPYLYEMKHIKQAMIAAAIGKIRAYEAHQKEATELKNEKEVQRLQKLISEWKKILEDLLVD